MAVATCVALDLDALNLDDPALFEDAEEEEEEATVAKPSPVPSGSTSTKRGKANRRQRRRREGAEPPAAVPQDATECCSLPCDNNGNERLFTALDSAFLREQATFAQRAESMSESCGVAAESRAASTNNNNAETAESTTAACASRKVRRKRTGGKRKKQPTPECQDRAAREEERGTALSVNTEGLSKDADSDSDSVSERARGSERQFLWRSLTKNGSIKKCVLVDGIATGGRPKLGDTVLVKSQGKLRDGRVIDDHPTLVFNVGEHEVVEGLDLAVQSMHKNELAILSIKPEVAYGDVGRKGDIPGGARITYLFGLLHFEKQKLISQLTWAQRRKSGQARLRLANWWYQRKEYSVAVKCYKKALEYYNNIPTNRECSTAEEYRELLQLMEERLRVMRQVANIFKRIANLIQSGQIKP